MVESTKVALLAGAGEAFRSRKEPEGRKGKRVLTAAAGAVAINAFLLSGKTEGERGGRTRVAESVVGGLAVNYLVHGSRHKKRSRSRFPSRGREDRDDRDREERDVRGRSARGLATAPGTASVNGSKSRGGSGRYSSSDYDSDGERKKRGRGLGDLARAGMAKLGLGRDKNVPRRDL